MDKPLISVVIPTFRRPHLIQRAVTSALSQTFDNIEVVVVIDGVDDGTRAMVDALGDPRTKVVETGNNQGPACARNYGVRNATGYYIALLDDDDEWTPNKLTVQLRLIDDKQLIGEFLVSSRGISKTLQSECVYPDRILQPDEDFSEYLLGRRLFRRNGVSSGTLLFPRSLAVRIPFPNDTVMEDYGWLLLCAMGEGTPVFMCPEPLFIYHQAPVSRNTAMNWHLCLEWVNRYHEHMSGRAMASLLASTIAWRAKRQGGYRAFRVIARTMMRKSRPQLLHWLMLGGIALLPVNVAERLRHLRP